ncbi:hypothetical protein CI603_01210 [Bifidobacterium sp. wkB338]|nr:hypothetical protein CI603_01210 [Bifidobacterium sp. wkB338]
MNFIHVVRKYMPGHILAYTASLLLGILAQAVVLLQPQLSGALIDGVQQHKAIVLIAVQLGILFILGAVLTAIQQAILGTIGEKSLYSIRNSRPIGTKRVVLGSVCGFGCVLVRVWCWGI